MWRNPMLRACSLVLLALVGGARPVAAASVLQYAGTPYTVASAPYDTAMNLSATIALVSPLASNLDDVNQRDNVASFAISLGPGPAFALHNLFLSTDAAGAITDWYMTGAVDPSGVFSNTFFASCGPASFPARRQSPTPGYDIVWHSRAARSPCPSSRCSPPPPGRRLGPRPSLAMLAALGLCGIGVATRRRQGESERRKLREPSRHHAALLTRR